MVGYQGARVLVTGGTGFVGSRLAVRLCAEEGASVRVLVRAWHKATWVSAAAVELIQGDVLDPASLNRAMSGCEVVFHCASGAAAQGGYARTNVEGVRNVLAAAREAGVRRLVYLSSIAVHGPHPPDPVTEDSPYHLCGRDYSDSKIRAEQLLAESGRGNGVPAVILRPTFVWGPRSSLFTVRQLRAMKHGRFALVDEGRGRCSAVYVDNLVDAMLLAGRRPEAEGEAFLITDGQDNVTWAEFFGHYAQWLGIARLPSVRSQSLPSRVIASRMEPCQAWLNRLAGSPAPFSRRVLRRALREGLDLCARFGYQSAWDVAKYTRSGRVDISKARAILGYQPRYSLETGMRETRRWVLDQMGFELGLADGQEPCEPDGSAEGACELSH